MGFNPSSFATGRTGGGFRARKAGEAFETLILASCTDAKGRVCRLTKIGSGARWAKVRGELAMVPQKSAADFMGCVEGTGRLLAFDCKRVGEDAASLRVNDPKILKPHQREMLLDLADAGGICGLLVECCRHGDFRWLAAKHLRRASPVKWDDPCWVILGGNGGLVPLRGLLSAYERGTR